MFVVLPVPPITDLDVRLKSATATSFYIFRLIIQTFVCIIERANSAGTEPSLRSWHPVPSILLILPILHLGQHIIPLYHVLFIPDGVTQWLQFLGDIFRRNGSRYWRTANYAGCYCTYTTTATPNTSVLLSTWGCGEGHLDAGHLQQTYVLCFVYCRF
jgi:hypothetical protein